MTAPDISPEAVDVWVKQLRRDKYTTLPELICALRAALTEAEAAQAAATAAAVESIVQLIERCEFYDDLVLDGHPIEQHELIAAILALIPKDGA